MFIVHVLPAVRIGKVLREKLKNQERIWVCFVLKKYEEVKKVTSRKKEVLKSREAEHMIYRVTQFPEMHSKSY